MKEKILAKGAEAILIQKGNLLIKRRISKGYRLKEIDEKLRKSRTKAEAKIMQKLENKIFVPKIIKVNVSDFARENKDNHNERGRELKAEIEMEFIKGKRLVDYLDSFPIKQQLLIAKEIGKQIGKIHDENLIHGDLTTSNMILVSGKKVEQEFCNAKLKNEEISELLKCNSKKAAQDCKNSLVINNVNGVDVANANKLNKNEKNSELPNFKVFFIDFGLGFHSSKIEDKAVDLHLIKQALEAKHFQHWEKLYHSIIKGYSPKDKLRILTQLEKVELRGRYKH